jgi:hypothetical protein
MLDPLKTLTGTYSGVASGVLVGCGAVLLADTVEALFIFQSDSPMTESPPTVATITASGTRTLFEKD